MERKCSIRNVLNDDCHCQTYTRKTGFKPLESLPGEKKGKGYFGAVAKHESTNACDMHYHAQRLCYTNAAITSNGRVCHLQEKNLNTT
eukprot:gene9126-16786_t